MRLKEIKPGMEVQCENKKELNILLEEAERLGYLWANGDKPTQGLKLLGHVTIHFDHDRRIAWSRRSGIKFCNLILPELTAEEVQKICVDICDATSCKECPMGADCYRKKDADFEKIVEICTQWKTDHEKNPEFEWVDICRIIKVHPDGRKECVYEEDVTERELPFGASPEPECEKVLKKYIADHEGEYFAVASHAYRVKE